MSAVTVARLHKMLGALVAAGHGRKPVCIDKLSFTHPCEDDGTTILNVINATGPRWIALADDDGGTKWNRDGTEAGKTCVVLVGENFDSPAPDEWETAKRVSDIPLVDECIRNLIEGQSEL